MDLGVFGQSKAVVPIGQDVAEQGEVAHPHHQRGGE